MKRIPDHIEQSARNMIAQDEKYWVIAYKLGVSPAFVKTLKKKINDKAMLDKIGELNTPLCNEVLHNFRSGEDTMTIAAKFNMPEWQVDSILNNALFRARLNKRKT